ncbi:hypothetical protein RIF29_11650 [Crotalaria pallida]|uniref:Uncharacterized protein n=1 Tax=Crotalaria pallida TaxID=3830 RepID=A0AAN9P075_CROPI
MKTHKIDKDGQESSSHLEKLYCGTRVEANGHASVMHKGCSSEPRGHAATQICQDVLGEILTSEKFRSLWKCLYENFQGMKPESVFDFSIMISRIKGKAYEQSPALFLSDLQQLWQKLQDTGNEIVTLAKSLSNLSRTSYYERVGIPAQRTFEDEARVFNNRASDSDMKPVQTEEHATYKICNCKRCGDKADGTDRLVCDSCEEVYHVSCIEPAVKEIPHKSWYCANCTARGIGSPHENCMVCEKLNESFHMNEETLDEMEKNSNCTYDVDVDVSMEEENTPNCKICGNDVGDGKIKKCGHPFCPNKYYHVRCLTRKQLKSYGHCWYCPSCLCRVCLSDQDDDKIVLCDGCDHAYHLYCMKPPRTSIPKGKWFCRKCDIGIQAKCRAKVANKSKKRRRIGDDVSKPSISAEKKHSNKHVREFEKGGGMDMLLNAANTLNLEEKLTKIQIDSKRT